MLKKMTRIAGGTALAAALLLGGTTVASATQGQTWTMTSCNFNGGNVSYTYTSSSGSTVTTAASVGATFVGTEDQMAAAVAEQILQ